MLYTHFLGILLCVAGSYALYDSSSDVVLLTPSNFDNLVLKSNEIWLVEFFAPWCGHCKNLVPEYKKAAAALKGIAKVGAVDADAHKSLSQTYGVSGFPTIKIFTGGKHVPFQGQRTAEKFVDAVLQKAKEKAYEALGKKGSQTSDKKVKKTYGHNIPWRHVPRAKQLSSRKKLKAAKHPKKTTKKSTNQKKTIKQKGKTTDVSKFNDLQLQLFRSKLLNLNRPKLAKEFLSKINFTIDRRKKADEIRKILNRVKKSTKSNAGKQLR